MMSTRASRPARLPHGCSKIPRRSSACLHSQWKRNAHGMGAIVRDTSASPWAMPAVICRAVLGQRINVGKVDAKAQGMTSQSHPLLACQHNRFFWGKTNKHGFLMRHIGLGVRLCRFDTVIPMHATANHCTSAARAWPAYRRGVHLITALTSSRANGLDQSTAKRSNYICYASVTLPSV
jgi:hypothetical protein